jgi:hypothetical protein
MDMSSWPDARNAPLAIAWAMDAPAGEVAEYHAHLGKVVHYMARHLDARADRIASALLHEEEVRP